MNKRIRQYLGLAFAVLSYYVVHEGAHLLYALSIGTFRCVRFPGLGIQIDVYAESMTNLQMGLFCLLGPVATLCAAWMLTAAAGRLAKLPAKGIKACLYYTTAALLFLDPLYLSLLYSFVGGGDMNGISLLFPAYAVRFVSGGLLGFHTLLFVKHVLPIYRKSFEEI